MISAVSYFESPSFNFGVIAKKPHLGTHNELILRLMHMFELAITGHSFTSPSFSKDSR
jgi:hypothetical protein